MEQKKGRERNSAIPWGGEKAKGISDRVGISAYSSKVTGIKKDCQQCLREKKHFIRNLCKDYLLLGLVSKSAGPQGLCRWNFDVKSHFAQF